MVAACGGDSKAPATTSTLAATTTLPATTTTTSTTTTTTIATTTTSTLAPTTTTSSTTTTTTSPATTTTLAPGAVLVLRANGLGSAAFGADPDGVIEFVSSIIGKPDVDTGWIDPLSLGSCPGTVVRTVAFGDLDLQFGDQSVVLTGRRHFVSYTYGPAFGAQIEPAGLKTDAGIGVGDTVALLRGTYPDVVIHPADQLAPATFSVAPGLTGVLSGDKPTDLVTVIHGGFGCGE